MKISLIVLIYNHERYIRDCLNSIKLQMKKYNSDGNHVVQLVLTNDASTDMSEKVVLSWVNDNRSIFSDIIYINNEKNLGTCKNYLNALKRCTGDYIKVIGGDDMFPETSIFDIFKYLDEYDIVQGIPFSFCENGNNNVEKMVSILNKTHRIYVREEKTDFYNMIHRYCFLNAPSTYVAKSLLTDERVMNFILEYKYTDDYPQWLKMSEIKRVRYAHIPIISVIYRRTEGSSFIIHSDELKAERLKIYQYALSKCENIRGRLLLSQVINAIKHGRNRPKTYLNLLSFFHVYYNFCERNRELFDSEMVANTIKYIDSIKME